MRREAPGYMITSNQQGYVVELRGRDSAWYVGRDNYWSRTAANATEFASRTEAMRMLALFEEGKRR